MTDQEINIAIAEACGLTAYPDRPDYGFDSNGKACLIPNYATDLNAMHEAEKILMEMGHDGLKHPGYFTRSYGVQIRSLLGGIDECSDVPMREVVEIAMATARQRAEAFLRTIGKWNEVAV